MKPDTTNQLEKRYFTPGNLGFPAFRATSLKGEDGASPIVGQLICNDRRWAEGWREYGLQGTEIVCCGYVSLIQRRVLMVRTLQHTRLSYGAEIKTSRGKRPIRKPCSTTS